MSHKQSKSRRRLFGEGMRQLSTKLNLCLWPGSKCERPAIRAHSLQNNGILDQISRNGQVVMPRLKVTLSEVPRFEFQEVGCSFASTFTGLCSEHDQELFRPIDLHPLDTSNGEQLFLLAYRSVLKEAHASRKSAIDTQSVYVLGSKHGLYPSDRPSAPGLQAVEQMTAAYLVEQVKEYFATAYLLRQWDSVSHTYFEIDVPPSVAVSSMFTTGLYSTSLDGPAFVTLNVFPHNGRTAALFSCITEDSQLAKEAFGRVFSATGQFQQYELSKLILRKCENFAISPDLFDRFGAAQEIAVTQYFERNTAGQSFEVDDPRIFLFTAVPDQEPPRNDA